MDQANVALQVINALYRREQQGAEELSAAGLAEDVAPKFPDVRSHTSACLLRACSRSSMSR